MKTTRENIEAAFRYFCEAHGYKIAKNYKDVGALQLDYSPIYGGYIVEEIVNEGGAVRHPFTLTRMSAVVMYNTLWFSVWQKASVNREEGEIK